MASIGELIKQDREALEALFDATGGANWKTNTGWKEDPDLSRWHGIAVNEQGRVKSIDLRRNGLRGMPATLICVTQRVSP